MSTEPETFASRRIHILREHVSRKIAAGEVIDRPFSVIRELLDNSIDAGARSIDVYIESGGLSRIRVVDDGEGMSREDLALCTQAHATSKIEDVEDLYRVTTLGFRGEALASIAACSRLEITSGTGHQGAHRLEVEGGKVLALEACQGNPGTVAEVADLFFNLPVRRIFLKSAAAEGRLCRQTLLEKALPHPQIVFRFFSDSRLRQFFPTQNLKERVAAAYSLEVAHLYETESHQTGAHIRIVAARPELNRRDRKMIQVYVNRRRIFEYSLVQAVEYAFSEYIPGGSFPIAYVFLELDPAMVDFNIHPAKREARFSQLASLHQGIVSAIKSWLKGFNIRAAMPPALDGPVSGRTLFYGPTAPAGQPDRPEGLVWPLRGAGLEPAGGPGPARRGSPAAGLPADAEPAVGPRYRGQLFNLFLLVELGESLYVVDQHAAHERVLFEQLKGRNFSSQELLMPINLGEAGPLAELLFRRKELFERLGIKVEKGEEGEYAISALPEQLLCLKDEELVQALFPGQGSAEELEEKILSLVACRMAVKEGEELDPLTAQELVRLVFRVDNARCPHGRPIWFEIAKQDLFRRVGRL